MAKAKGKQTEKKVIEDNDSCDSSLRKSVRTTKGKNPKYDTEKAETICNKPSKEIDTVKMAKVMKKKSQNNEQQILLEKAKIMRQNAALRTISVTPDVVLAPKEATKKPAVSKSSTRSPSNSIEPPKTVIAAESSADEEGDLNLVLDDELPGDEVPVKKLNPQKPPVVGITSEQGMEEDDEEDEGDKEEADGDEADGDEADGDEADGVEADGDEADGEEADDEEVDGEDDNEKEGNDEQPKGDPLELDGRDEEESDDYWKRKYFSMRHQLEVLQQISVEKYQKAVPSSNAAEAVPSSNAAEAVRSSNAAEAVRSSNAAEAGSLSEEDALSSRKKALSPAVGDEKEALVELANRTGKVNFEFVDVFPISQEVINRASKKFPSFVNDIMTSVYTHDIMATRCKSGKKGTKPGLNQDEVEHIVDITLVNCKDEAGIDRKRVHAAITRKLNNESTMRKKRMLTKEESEQ